MSNYNEIDLLNDIVLLNHNDIVKTIDETSIGINPIPSFEIAKGISAEVSAIEKDYFKLDANNDVSGKNKFIGQQDFSGLISATSIDATSVDVSSFTAKNARISSIEATSATIASASIESATIEHEQVQDSTIGNVEVEYLSVDFGNLKNTKNEYLSSLHDNDQIKTVNNIYRMVDEIEVEAGLHSSGLDYSIDLSNLVDIEIKERIIRGKQLELFGKQTIEDAPAYDPLRIFYKKPTAEIELYNIVDALQQILNRLKIAKYSLADKLRSIEKSIDALEFDLQDGIDTIDGKVTNALTSIEQIDGNIDALSADYALENVSGVSIVTSLKQTSGKVTLTARQLLSSDVRHLSSFVNDTVDALKKHTADNYLPLTGGTMNGDLKIDAKKSFYVGDSNNIVVNGNTLCSILSNEITLSTSTAYADLSSKLSNDFDFSYDPVNNVLCAKVAGRTRVVSAAKFTEARMLESVSVEIYDNRPILKLKFKTDIVGTFTEVSVDLMTIMPLYAGNDGIDIQYENGKYQVSADNTICRRNDISALDVENTIEDGNILTSLAQIDGKIRYKQTKLLSSHVGGLTNYVEDAIDNSEKDIRAFTSTLSGNSGVISALCSAVDAKIQSLDFVDPGFYDTGKVKVLASLSETNGKISASTEVLDYRKIDGLSTAIDAKFDKTGGAIDGSLSVAKNVLVNGAKSMTSGPNGGIAIGRNAVLSNEEAFVWSGAQDEPIVYKDHGQRTFNINPMNGLSGVYIGEENLHSTLSLLSGTIDTKISAIYSTVIGALDRGGIEGKDVSQITLANVISCIYFLGKALKDIKTMIEG